MQPEPDYISINRAVALPARIPLYNVVLMKWDHREKEYVMSRCSQALRKEAAESLAHAWANAAQVRIR